MEMKIARVNLTESTIEIFSAEDELLRKYL